MSLYDGIYTLEEIDAELAHWKVEIAKPNASYSYSPADGGTARSVTRWSLEDVQKRIAFLARVRRSLTGNSKGLSVKHARFHPRGSARTGTRWDT